MVFLGLTEESLLDEPLPDVPLSDEPLPDVLGSISVNGEVRPWVAFLSILKIGNLAFGGEQIC